MKLKWVRISGSDTDTSATWAADVPGGVLIASVWEGEDGTPSTSAMVFVPGLEIDYADREINWAQP